MDICVLGMHICFLFSWEIPRSSIARQLKRQILKFSKASRNCHLFTSLFFLFFFCLFHFFSLFCCLEVLYFNISTCEFWKLIVPIGFCSYRRVLAFFISMFAHPKLHVLLKSLCIPPSYNIVYEISDSRLICLALSRTWLLLLISQFSFDAL